MVAVTLLALTAAPLTACGVGQDPFASNPSHPPTTSSWRSPSSAGGPGGTATSGGRPSRPGARPSVISSGTASTSPTRTSVPSPRPTNDPSVRPSSTPTSRRTPTGTDSPPRVPSRPPRRPGSTSPKVLYLTFDDGPSELYTPQVLALLQQYRAHAVFCEIGYAVAAHPELTRQVVAAGHTLCDHTLNHDEKLRERSLSCIRYEIDGGLNALRAAAPGVRVPFYRAPGGAWSARVRDVAEQDKMASLTWTIDPRDWSRPGVAHIIATVMAGVRDHAVLLMHDGGGPREETVTALTQLLPRLAALGYRFEVPPKAMFRSRHRTSASPTAEPTTEPSCATRAACCPPSPDPSRSPSPR